MIISGLGIPVEKEKAVCFNGKDIFVGFNGNKENQILFKPEKREVVDSGFSNEFCYFIGSYLGDGNMDWRMNKDGTDILITGVRQVVNEDALPLIQKSLGRFGLTLEGDTSVGKDGNVYHNCDVQGKGVRKHGRLVHELCGRTDDKRVPEFIFNETTEKKSYFLAGLLDTDGSISRGCRVKFDNKLLNLVTGFSILCGDLGIITRIHSGKVKYKGKYLDYDFYSVSVLSGRGVDRFKELVPLQIGYKKNELSKFKDNSSENFGYLIDKDYIHCLKNKLHGVKYSYLKDRLREYCVGRRKYITHVMLEEMVEVFDDEELLHSLLDYIPTNIFSIL